MYDYSYNYDVYNYNSSVSSTGGIIAGLGIFLFFVSVIGIFNIVCMWKLFKKAGKPGWESIVPVYNIIVLIEIAGLPLWYIVLFLIPLANIYVIFKVFIEIAHRFNKSTGFGVAMVFFNIICLPILVFGKSHYKDNASSVNRSDNVISMQNNSSNNIGINMQNNVDNSVQNNFVNSNADIISFNDNNININSINNGTVFNENNNFTSSAFHPIGNVNNNIQNNSDLNNEVQNNLFINNDANLNSNLNYNSINNSNNELVNNVDANSIIQNDNINNYGN